MIRDVGGRSQATLGFARSTAVGRPVVTAAGRFLAPANRYFPRMHSPVEPDELVAAIEAEVTAGAAWVKIIGDAPEWGADGPDGYDCSGLVYAAYAAAGLRIARTTFGWRQDGPQVPLSQIQPGDLLFSAGSDGTPADPGHVVMYLGGGQVIQAPQAGQDVQVDPLSLAGVVVAARPAALPHTS